MYKTMIFLDTVSDAKKFVNLCNSVPFDVSLASGQYIVNAKSIMGIFSLDLSISAEVRADCAEDDEFVQKLEAFLAP